MVDINNSGKHQPRRRALTWVLWPLVIIGFGLWVSADFRQSVDAPLALTKSTSFRIEQGEGVMAVGRRLKARGILAEPFWFECLAYRRGDGAALRYGDYEINRGMTARSLLDMFVAGRVRQQPVTLIEGWSFSQVRSALLKHPTLKHHLGGLSDEAVMAQMGAPGLSPEGRFFPDTYFVGKHTSDLDILQKAYDKMKGLLDHEWHERAPTLPLTSSTEALVLASIIEKETARPEERPAIAGVFIRRLQQGMRLQTDPTVIFGMGELYRGNIRREDLRRDTPYNTYTRNGLPPTPIALAGRKALHAALHPAEGNSLYFVAKGDGTHVFSSTLTEHERAVDQYQRH